MIDYDRTLRDVLKLSGQEAADAFEAVWNTSPYWPLLYGENIAPHFPVAKGDTDALKARLRAIKAGRAGFDPESEGNHRHADRVLLDFIGDPEVTKLFDDIEKWYA